ncbi:hypothetical protein [Hymenobacter elongatus]|uniref:Heme-binding protein HmuY n=1 Tax=Hymenobacter elongatus TaxID=877208 RepID=A0A4Z0PH76_9BACT|nr:hypothetical protein [Hymenobacter elongatus]TGE14191.1 hypothetical protein E5J99_17315 [Hymenobacter elongatus]
MKALFPSYRLALLTLGISCSFGLASCFEKDEDPTPDETAVSDSLHFAFKTPDWAREIDCEQLNLSFKTIYSTNDKIAWASAGSQSTGSQFYFTYPADSSALVAPGKLTKYAIGDYLSNTGAFEMSHKVPTTEGSASRLLSVAGKADNSYNEILSVKYIKHEGAYALFDIKGRYQMQMKELTNGVYGATKPVSGSFKFRLRAAAK